MDGALCRERNNFCKIEASGLMPSLVYMNILTKFLTLIIKYRNSDLWINIGRCFVLLGVGLIAGPRLVALLFLQVAYKDISLNLDFSNNMHDVLAVLLIAIGLSIVILRLFKLEKTLTGILIFHEGMSGMDLSEAEKALPNVFKKGKLRSIVLDEGDRMELGRVLDAKSALESIKSLPLMLKSELNDVDSSCVNLAYSGLAPIPFLFAAGYLLTSRKKILFLDYHRGEGWHCLDSLDDKEEILSDVNLDEDAKDIALILPFSVEISTAQIPDNLGDNTIRLSLEGGARIDSLNSEEKQKRISNLIYETIANKIKDYPSARCFHLFIASQASMVARLGSMISSSVHVEVRVYQYDPGAHSYLWGVSLRSGKFPVIVGVSDPAG